MGYSLVLHSTSPTAHNIATSKVAVIFANRLRRGNKEIKATFVV